MPAVFTGSFNITLEHGGIEAGWSYIIESANNTSVLGNIVCRFAGDDGTKPLTNVINTQGVQRIIRTGLTTGGFDSPHFSNKPVVEKNLYMTPIASSAADNGTLFMDSGTGKLSFKDPFGAVFALY